MKRFRKLCAFLLALALMTGIAGTPASAALRGDGKLYHVEEAERLSMQWAVDAINWYCRHPGYRSVKAGSPPLNAEMVRGWLLRVIHSMESFDQWDGDKSDPEFIGFPLLNSEGNLESSAPVSFTLWAKNAGIYYGTGAPVEKDLYYPTGILTREDLITFTYRYMQYRDKIYRGGTGEGLDVPEGFPEQFTDTGKISPYAADAMKWAVANKIVSGRSPSTLNPRETANVAETVTVLYRALNQQGYETPGP